MNEKDLLKFLVDSGKIDFTAVQQEYEQMNRKQVLEQHEQKIWKGKDGRWRTYVFQNNERRLIAKSEFKDLEDAIYECYNKPIDTFKGCFDRWIDEKLKFGEIQRQTFDRYKADFKRYIENTDLENREIEQITESYLEDFIKTSISQNNLTAKNWGNMRILLTGTFVWARKHDLTTIRIGLFLSELQLSAKIFERKIVKDETQVFSAEEETKIIEYIEENPDLLGLGIELAFNTGLRIGEVSALKWSDIADNILTVQRTEIKYISESGERITDVRESTKGKDGWRYVILSDKAKNVLEKLKNYSESDNFIFTRDNMRIKSKWLALKIENICKELDLPHRSFHKIRKTYATKLLDAGVGERLIEKQMGHTDILTTKKFYYFNNEQIDQIRDKLNKV